MDRQRGLDPRTNGWKDPEPRVKEGAAFVRRMQAAFQEGWDAHEKGRGLYAFPADYNGARLAGWRAGWWAARHTSEPLAGAVEAGADEMGAQA